MTINEFEQLFKGVVEAYPKALITDPTPLNYLYNRLWVFNGLPSAEFPAVVLERQPRVTWRNHKQNLIPQIEIFTFKVMFFDTYWSSERETVLFSAKQEELMQLARQVFAEIERRDREEGHNMNFSYKGNFFGDIDTNSNELIELSCECTVELKVSCDKLTFIYA